ncbi:5-(carboxyamino)imidazole ribonucleotide synthase [Alkaliphilus hydrothermalis]|uniref:N5-carboxyaminoimidazole ribonucleotide synthase n=1 Tax=Alkaliphilus hydrothermalis TaxID=1482730 RepID=A0ABS2NSS8_9FIRM|nr:5-(carboxyamino)imidazole ribonucleotide synthase [Alkaliphilus hydrothermalis]MBM7616025.1 5-(carboxyamino)imidazole ribonucleotide synthase [Alkaliphilus hydrothermalis]
MNQDISQIKVGIVGGGQLGKMMVLEGKKMGIYFVVLDPNADCPAASIVDELIVGDFYDPLKIKKLAEKCDVITYEFEHINAEVLIDLQKSGHKIYPSPHTLMKIQDKAYQKQFLQSNDIPVANFEVIDSLDDLNRAVETFGVPLLLKSCRGGYDGKGNYLIKSHDEIEEAYKALGEGVWKLMVEEFVPFTKEISVVVGRGISGDLEVFPLCENLHENNILKMTIFPARVNDIVATKAKELAFKTMEVLEGVGVFCIEMFVTEEEDVLVNEIAPRTHNSGHYTIEGCSISQFGQHIRSILELPLGKVQLNRAGVMINILGEANYRGKAKLVGAKEALALPQVFLHYYGKITTSPYRKVGHVTILGDTIDEAFERAEIVKNTIKVIGEEVI